ncbi:MAG: hypothetical protein K8T26_12325 [Lentisphaerae bacterium]|nr:hypothetical protein [Lentisphaerota bacterium]
MRILRGHGRWLAAVACGLALAGGCISDQPGSASIAHVVLESATQAQARAAIVRVFTDEGYHVTDEAVSGLTFEREGTQRDRVMYARYQEALIMRVVVQLEPHRMGGTLVRADAFAIHDGSDEQKVLWIGRRPYQAILDSVRASLVTSEKVP